MTDELLNSWRRTVAEMRAWGDERGATVLDRAASELERVLQEEQTQPLRLCDASRVSGYSPDHLGRLLREGKIPNIGRPGAPRVRRGDIPTKMSSVAKAKSNRYDPIADARSLLVRRLRQGEKHGTN